MIKEAAKLELPRRLRAVLFIDVVDSVRLIHEDEAGTIGRWRSIAGAMREHELPRFGGRLVKLLGDGMLIEFESAIAAVECAIAIQQRIAAGEQGHDANLRIRVRMGIHASDVIADEFDIYGDGVNLAARLRDLGGPDEIVVSAAVRDQLTDGLGMVIEDLGERKLKGLDRQTRAYRVWPPGSHVAAPVELRRRAGDRPAIAVLPFRNLSSDPANEFLGDMLAEDVIGALSRQTDLFVISRLSTVPFRNRLYETRNVAELLGVRYVISGTMQIAGARLRLVAELAEAEAGQVIWSDRFEGSTGDVFELEDELSRNITERVVPFVRQRELQRARAKRPESLTAYERTLRAIGDLHRSAPENLENAREMLEAAIELDPQYAAAHAWLSFYFVRRVGQGWSVDRRADIASANREAMIARERDETNSWVLAVSGLVEAYLNKNLDLAIGFYDRALTINPSEASAWAWSSTAHAWIGDGREATLRAPRAIELSPFDPSMYAFTSMAAMAHLVAGEYDVALSYSRQSLRHNRMFVSTHRVLTIALMLAGKEEEARAAARDLMVVEPTLTVTGFVQRFPGTATPQAALFADALREAGVPQ